mmetsp:Transcript_34635/g.68099  ORF Transcript_34635/g.68099 Transcript_34635/m.68099 type:complete len:418 (-) Transcript_34635:71-1324(-)|eukprot:CAMPEP_0175153408 /NCGR_PEP_ID=MMETSP0087-20121206/19722_1 /TAXON_ID=136419 /ORGANISM="Unknown Unknown, Strain D1" /LENGTH=417 /DNA_ID=CAMNT_0016440087 /DNA_START=28 /DNA_END=1281 /DNA_ORIENTATION=+
MEELHRMEDEEEKEKKKPAFARPTLNLGSSMMETMNESVQLSTQGTINLLSLGLQINRYGLRDGRDKDSRIPKAEWFTETELCPEDLMELGSLGQGAGGIVKKCLHVKNYKLIALKTVNIFDKDKRHQFENELKALNATVSPHVVHCFGCYFESGQTKLALEYVNRGSLEDVVNKYGALNESCLASIAKQALLGLQHLHSCHKVHRDIKPANILCDVNGQVKIADFGITAGLADTEDFCTTYVGTALYMSPERIKTEQYSYPCDIWSLGMTLVTCALGKCPIGTEGGFFALVNSICDEPNPQLPNTFSPLCRSFVASCLVKDPEKRSKITALLAHPWIAKLDVEQRADWPFPNFGGEQEETDLMKILEQMKRNLAGKKYRKSLFDVSRFNQIGMQLGFNSEGVIARYEQMIGAAGTG